MKKLPRLVQATRMLVCAEDLGMVPDCVPWVMNELKILSLEIQSMPKDNKLKFGHLQSNPYRSVSTIHLYSPSMLCLISLQDWLSIDEELRLPDADAERINVPANPRHYWRYRMHMTIEDLMNNSEFNAKIKQLIAQSYR